MRPNVLLIVLDAARRDYLEPYGAVRGSTPVIADLARRGHALPSAYATASWTLPSHVSLLSGMLPREAGLAQPPGGGIEGACATLRRLPQKMISTALRDAGYVTHGVSTNLWISHHAGFDVGFDTFSYISGGRDERLNSLVGRRLHASTAWALDGLRSRSDDGAADAGLVIRKLIDAWDGRPTFWFVNLVECHSPYLPPRPWNDLPAVERLTAALEARRYLNFLAICLYIAGHHEISERTFDRMRHLYQRAISYMDRWIGDVLELLDAKGILDETLVIVTSDHGENFGEKGLIAHGWSLDERMLHVPLVVCGPGAAEQGGVFSLAQLPAMVADAAQIEQHPWAQSELPRGTALAQWDPMASSNDPRMIAFQQRWGLDEGSINRLAFSAECAVEERYKLVVRDGVEQRFDLLADPGEDSPLAGDVAPEHFDRLRRALSDRGARTAPPPTLAELTDTVTPPEEQELIERQMKLLGYM